MLQVGSFKLYGIISANDLSIEEAEVIARRGLRRKELFNAAIVDPKQGLMIFDIFYAVGIEHANGYSGFHLQTPRCGYDGEESRAAARILAMYDFGEYDELYVELSSGGSKGQLCLTRRMVRVL